jgi:hypothetical protein
LIVPRKVNCSPSTLLEERFTVIEQNEREIAAALKRSEALRQSILKKAFSGQLVPQNPDDEPTSEFLARIRAERFEQEAAAAKKPASPKPTNDQTLLDHEPDGQSNAPSNRTGQKNKNLK